MMYEYMRQEFYSDCMEVLFCKKWLLKFQGKEDPNKENGWDLSMIMDSYMRDNKVFFNNTIPVIGV